MTGTCNPQSCTLLLSTIPVLRGRTVRYWPERAWQKFLMLWHEWCVRDCFPDNWNHCRHVMLPKDSDYCDGILPCTSIEAHMCAVLDLSPAFLCNGSPGQTLVCCPCFQ